MNTHRHMHWGVLIITVMLVGNFLIGEINKTYQINFSSTEVEASGEPLLHQADLTYLGAFLVPGANYGGTVVQYDPRSNSIFVSYLGTSIGEFSIPSNISPLNTTVASLPVATNLHSGFYEITAGHRADTAGSGWTANGLLPLGADNFLLGETIYFGVPNNNKGLAIVSRNIANPSFVSGWYAMTIDGTTGSGVISDCDDVWLNPSKCQSNVTSQGFIPIPGNWQTALDGDMLGGSTSITTQPQPGWGPSFTSFWTTDIGVKIPIPGHRLVFYQGILHPSLGGRPGSDGVQVPPVPPNNPYLFAGQTELYNGVWPAGTRSILHFSTVGTPSNYCYGPATGDLADGIYTNEPVGNSVNGTGASTSADGRTITVPYADLISGAAGAPGHAIYLHGLTDPKISNGTQHYQGASGIIANGNSGQANAYVTVSTPFAGNLTGKDFTIGELMCYNPMGNGSTSATSHASSQHGPMAYPYNLTVMAYDANDLAAVKSGTKNEWEPIPYDYWTFTTPFGYPTGPAASKDLGGASYDPATHRIYLAQKNVNNVSDTIITVWNVNTSGNGGPSAPHVSIFANPNPVSSGSPSAISWSSVNTTSCTASGGWSGSKATSGSQSFSPTTATTYTLSCTGPGGTDTQSVTVSISSGTPAPSPTPPTPSPSTPSPSPTPGTPSTYSPLPGNVASSSNGATASASSTNTGANYVPASAINNDRKGLRWNSGGGWNDDTPYTFPDWWQVDFSGTKNLNEVDVFSIQDAYAEPIEPTSNMTLTAFGLKNFEVQYWTGSTWQAVPGGVVTNNNLVWRKFTFNPIQTSKIRIYVTQSSDAQYSRLAEVEAYEAASTPAPIAGDLNNDGIVNSLDWSIMSSVWFTSNAAADLNHDGIVNSIDFSILNRNWFRSNS